MTTVVTARGCPYKCAFCQPLENNHFGKALRRRSVDSVIAELKQIKTLYSPECLMIHDDTFFLQRRWLEEFIEKYPEIGLPFWAAGRADGICKNPDLVKCLVEVGWELISVGFESGSQRILDKLKKGTTIEQNLESAEIIKSTGAKICIDGKGTLSFEQTDDDAGSLVARDRETGTTWNVAGHALAGPLVGTTLSPAPHWNQLFWFSWSTFKPGTRVHQADPA